jgi:hypothetical protein
MCIVLLVNKPILIIHHVSKLVSPQTMFHITFRKFVQPRLGPISDIVTTYCENRIKIDEVVYKLASKGAHQKLPLWELM